MPFPSIVGESCARGQDRRGTVLWEDNTVLASAVASRGGTGKSQANAE